MLNENNYSQEDCILITRTMLIKTKRLVRLCKEQAKLNNLDATIAGFKPPIFWKDKEIIKQQLKIGHIIKQSLYFMRLMRSNFN